MARANGPTLREGSSRVCFDKGVARFCVQKFVYLLITSNLRSGLT